MSARMPADALGIVRASGDADFVAAHGLLSEFREWLYRFYGRERGVLDAYFREEAVEAARRALGAGGACAAEPPGDLLLLARHGGVPVGCVLLRRLDPRRGEMKRLFVTERMRRGGIGRALCLRLLDEARDEGIERVVLDLGRRQTAATALFTSIGFRDTPPPDGAGHEGFFRFMAMRP